VELVKGEIYEGDIRLKKSEKLREEGRHQGMEVVFRAYKTYFPRPCRKNAIPVRFAEELPIDVTLEIFSDEP
jgi:hypothetical protein